MRHAAKSRAASSRVASRVASGKEEEEVATLAAKSGGDCDQCCQTVWLYTNRHNSGATIFFKGQFTHKKCW